MTEEYKDKVNYLNQVKHLKIKIKALKELKEDKKTLTGVSYENTGAKNFSNSNNTECKMVGIVDMSIRIDEEIQRLENLVNEIFKKIRNLNDDELEALLIARFLSSKPIKRIAKDFECSEESVKKKIHIAINKITL